MPDRPPHLTLVADEHPRIVAFRRQLGTTRTPFALADAGGIVALNAAGAPFADNLRGYDSQDPVDDPTLQIVVSDWDDETGLKLLELCPALPTATVPNTAQTDPISGAMEDESFEVAVEAAVATAQAEERSLVLFHLDFPHLEDIEPGSDGRGRADLLRTTARRLERWSGREGIVSRIEGGRFALLAPAPRGEAGALVEAERLMETLCIRRRLAGGTEAALRPRIGFAIMPTDTEAALTLLGGQPEARVGERVAGVAASLKSCADLALAEAVSKDATPAVRFSPALVVARRRRDELAAGVGTAIAEGQMKVAFQPVIDLATMKLAGFEALLRWRHPEYGPVPPPEAIAIAEANGALRELTRHVMREAIERCNEWPEGMSFAVNVTPSQLDAHLVDLIGDVLAEGGIRPESLEIEVTEDALIKDVDSSARVIDAVRALGVRVAMDDFGAGFTSLSNLKRLSFDKIKIDRSLCEGLGESTRTDVIVGGLVGLAERLGIEATVEGVETQAQLAALEGLPCLVQGYVFSPPVPPQGMDAFRAMLPEPERPDRPVQRSRPAASRSAS